MQTEAGKLRASGQSRATTINIGVVGPANRQAQIALHLSLSDRHAQFAVSEQQSRYAPLFGQSHYSDTLLRSRD
jgi:hypothetical protein